MSDMIFGGALLTGVFVLARSGSGHVVGLFHIVTASLEQILSQIG